MTGPRSVPATRIFHLVDPGEWARAVETGSYRAPSLDTDGFVHFSFADQVTGTANLLYRDAKDLVVVEVDPGSVDAELRVEDTYGSGIEFPHVYGPIPTDAAVAVHRLDRTASGDWRFTLGDEGAAAWRDR